ncbi:hypothetical protein CASFOL_027976 [Castilleja foliolosa]|uniref:Pectate lyase n=1 Tax=Castilleja foliolosa TaxID=1961234 RepID=A0ABD3CJL1_9LAMI
MPSMAMSLIISIFYLAVFLISSPSFVAATRTLQNRTESRRSLRYSLNDDNDNDDDDHINKIDKCLMEIDNWAENRQKLADCAIGFGSKAVGGKGGKFYEVTTTDDNPTNPEFGSLRYGVTRDEPLWITFKDKKMVFNLQQELIINGYKTLDGRGSEVRIAGPACLVIQCVEHVIIHGLYVYNCRPTGGGGIEVMSSQDHVGRREQTEGDAVSIWKAKHIWVDHNYLFDSADGLIDAVEGSTYITISNNRLSHHNEAMLLGHNDNYVEDKGLRVSILYNHFGPKLVQRIPSMKAWRVRLGGVEVVNNYYEPWLMYAVGGSAASTIVSKGNVYKASDDSELKEVTKHLDPNEEDWKYCNWISDGDLMKNGAFFTPSGSGDLSSDVYKDVLITEAKSSTKVHYLVKYAGPWKCGKNLEC